MQHTRSLMMSLVYTKSNVDFVVLIFWVIYPIEKNETLILLKINSYNNSKKLERTRFYLIKWSEDIIGTFYGINKHSQMKVQDLLIIENKEYVQLDDDTINFTVLSNNHLLIWNYLNEEDIKDSRQCITIHNQNFNLIKKEVEINGKSFSGIEEIAVNQEKGEVYILDKENCRIILVTDFELNFIKYFGSYGNKNNQFKYPFGICFKNGYLCVADCENYQIKVFNQDLRFIKSLQLECKPREVQTSNSVLAVTSD